MTYSLYSSIAITIALLLLLPTSKLEDKIETKVQRL